MKRSLVRIFAALLCICNLFFAFGCTQETISDATGDPSHVCSFTEQSTDAKYVKTAANCQSVGEYYYSCSCGEKGEATFFGTELGDHEYSVKNAERNLLKAIATCTSPAEYFCTCAYCGAKGEVSFLHGECTDHRYAFKEVAEKYLKSEATTESPALYYLSCLCGAAGSATFEHGSRLLTEEEKMNLLMPTSLTVTLYDAQNSVYGFTFNTKEQPQEPVIQIKVSGADTWSEYPLTTTQASSYDENDTRFMYYISKAEIELDANTTYIYRACNK